MQFYNTKKGAYKIAIISILAALTMTLSFLETLLPPLPMLPPGFKMGLSNIAVMYALFAASVPYALFLAVVKSFFILFINGGYAFVLSLGGSLLSVAAMAVLIKLFKTRISYSAISIIGALFHNGAQIILVCAITASNAAVYYTPVLVIAAIICGLLTAAVISALMPKILKMQIDK